MRKLSVVKERRSSAEGSSQKTGDIRGLDDIQLIKGSSFESSLFLKHPGELALAPTLTKYALETSHVSQFPGVHRLQTIWRQKGEHKLQALRLFFAALELGSSYPDLHAFLTYESGLHRELKQRMETEVHTHDAHELHSWVQSPHQFSIAQGIALALKQSGYAISTDAPMLNLSWTEAKHVTTTVQQDHARTEEKSRKRA
jgi:hypothetical protein